MKEKNIRLTDNAQKQLDKFKDEQVRKLIDTIVSNKSYPGIEDIEITGNDVAQYSKQVYIISDKKMPILKTLAWIYLVVGIIAILYGLYYKELKYIANNNPEQLISIFIGVIMVVLSLFILLRQRIRQRTIENGLY